MCEADWSVVGGVDEDTVDAVHFFQLFHLLRFVFSHNNVDVLWLPVKFHVAFVAQWLASGSSSKEKFSSFGFVMSHIPYRDLYSPLNQIQSGADYFI